jgi:outer membrane autotransporter protein
LERDLIDQGINRHGVILTLSKQLNARVNAYIYGGVSYEFESGEAEGRAGAGVEAYLAPNTSLNIGVDYTTSGNAGNRGNDVLSGTVGVKMSF